MFSDTVVLETEWAYTISFAVAAAVFLLSPAALSGGGAAVSATLKRWRIRLVMLLALGAVFDWASTSKYPVHTSGAVVVTGASSGIGRSAAIALAKQGYTAYAGVRKEKDAASIRAEAAALKGIPGGLKPLVIDVTKKDTIAAAVAEVAAAGEPLVALVNNAGIVDNLPLEVAADSHWDNTFGVNVRGLVDTTQHFLPLLQKSKGRVVNIGSMAGFLGNFPGMGVYTASKHAVEAISDAMRVEFLQDGISVSLVQPGAVKTPIMKKISDAQESTAALKRSSASDAAKAKWRPFLDEMHELGLKIPNDPMLPTPEITDGTIVHAVSSAFPKTRYMVCPDSQMFFLFNYLLPDRVLDGFMRWMMFNGGWRNMYGA